MTLRRAFGPLVEPDKACVEPGARRTVMFRYYLACAAVAISPGNCGAT